MKNIPVSYSSGQQGGIYADSGGEHKDIGTTSNKSLAEGKYQAQIDDLINHHKEDTKKVYSKYDRQKEFISIAAHELKSPITPILGVLELMEYEFEETNKKDEIVLKKERFDTILRNAKRLERLASEQHYIGFETDICTRVQNNYYIVF